MTRALAEMGTRAGMVPSCQGESEGRNRRLEPPQYHGTTTLVPTGSISFQII